jgi:hypothetical protein
VTAVARRLRVAAGVAIVAVFAAFIALVIPVYYRAWRFERDLQQMTETAGVPQSSNEALRVVVAERAARLGLPVRPDDVQFVRTPTRFRIEVDYRVPVYTVDLHFHPSAGN